MKSKGGNMIPMINENQHLQCSCANHHLLSFGDTCDICMGVSDVSETTNMNAFENAYDEEYFEALEAHYESIEYAA